MLKTGVVTLDTIHQQAAFYLNEEPAGEPPAQRSCMLVALRTIAL